MKPDQEDFWPYFSMHPNKGFDIENVLGGVTTKILIISEIP